jgi:hypothetical protein
MACLDPDRYSRDDIYLSIPSADSPVIRRWNSAGNQA